MKYHSYNDGVHGFLILFSIIYGKFNASIATSLFPVLCLFRSFLSLLI